MSIPLIAAILLPFFGTAFGSSWVLFPGNTRSLRGSRILSGFAAGVMTAASIWSLILPALDRSAGLGGWAFLPAFGGVWAGAGFLLLLDHTVPHLHPGSRDPEGRPGHIGPSAMLILAVTLHNLPEGMAVGAVAAGFLSGQEGISAAAVIALSLGIALQNIPEGAIISLPLGAAGIPRGRALLLGVLSGVVEPVGTLVTILLSPWLVPLLPWLLCFAAGAMLYVVAEELLPQAATPPHSDQGTLAFIAGFTAMMTLDVVCG